jgi:transcriptional regulator with XRE-family HTH domain
MTLQEWMKHKKLTDAALAAQVSGLSRSQVSRIRRRVSIPTPQTAKKLEEVTGIPAEAFVFAERAA